MVKRECATCALIEPLLPLLHGVLADGELLTIFTQDDPAFPSTVPAIHDVDLAVSWHHSVETVPTLIRVRNGAEVERTHTNGTRILRW